MLPLSGKLRRRPDEFYRWFCELQLLADPPSTPIDRRLFDEAGIELWEQLRAELQGQYEVIYYSQEFADYFTSPELFRTSRIDPHAITGK